MVGLILEEDELVGLVIGTVVRRVRHNKIIICEKTRPSPHSPPYAFFKHYSPILFGVVGWCLFVAINVLMQ